MRNVPYTKAQHGPLSRYKGNYMSRLPNRRTRRREEREAERGHESYRGKVVQSVTPKKNPFKKVKLSELVSKSGVVIRKAQTKLVPITSTIHHNANYKSIEKFNRIMDRIIKRKEKENA